TCALPIWLRGAGALRRDDGREVWQQAQRREHRFLVGGEAVRDDDEARALGLQPGEGGLRTGQRGDVPVLAAALDDPRRDVDVAGQLGGAAQLARDLAVDRVPVVSRDEVALQHAPLPAARHAPPDGARGLLLVKAREAA